MGGRGASSGISKSGKPYGSEYYTVKEVDNIKFVKSYDPKNNNKAPMETMTKNRIYVHINEKNQIKDITFHDNKNMRQKTIHIDHPHIVGGVKMQPHVHLGYEHSENGTRGTLSDEQRIIDKVVNAWYYN